jgi:hypothetical protein
MSSPPHHQAAQALSRKKAYNTRNGLLHDKSSLRVNLRPRAARDSVHSLEWRGVPYPSEIMMLACQVV